MKVAGGLLLGLIGVVGGASEGFKELSEPHTRMSSCVVFCASHMATGACMMKFVTIVVVTSKCLFVL